MIDFGFCAAIGVVSFDVFGVSSDFVFDFDLVCGEVNFPVATLVVDGAIVAQQ
jgi:hypothetical protein